MADQNLTQILAARPLTTLINSDILYVQTDNLTTPTHAAITGQNLRADLASASPRRNELVNGNFNIWQSGVSFVSPASAQILADTWRFYLIGTGVLTITRDTDVPTIAESGTKSLYSMKYDVTTADAAMAAGDICSLRTNMEGYRYNALKDNIVTLSFWVKAVKTGTYCVTFRNNGSDRSYVVEYTISSASTWEKKTITLTLNQTGGTENYTTGHGLSISWVLAAGSTFQTTANAWQTGNYLATSNQVNGIDNAANNFWLAQVKLEKGSTATEFVPNPFEFDLRECQRYIWKSFPYDTTPAQNAGVDGAIRFMAGKAGAGAEFYMLRLPVSMLLTPDVTFYNPSAANGEARDSTAAADCSATGSTPLADVISIVTIGNAGTAVGNKLDVHAYVTCAL